MSFALLASACLCCCPTGCLAQRRVLHRVSDTYKVCTSPCKKKKKERVAAHVHVEMGDTASLYPSSKAKSDDHSHDMVSISDLRSAGLIK